MKKTFYFLSILAAFFVTQNLFAQLPENVKVSTGDNEYWYYIQNGANPEIVSPAVNDIRDNGNLDKAGLLITTPGSDGSNQVYTYVWHINKNQDMQLWKLVDAGNNSYFLVNKKTGNKLALGTGTNSCFGENGANCKDLFYTYSDGNMSFSVNKIGDKSNFVTISPKDAPTKLVTSSGADKKWSIYEYTMEDEYDKPSNDGIMKSEKAWLFIPENEIKACGYPELSIGNNEKWYYIEFRGTHANLVNRVVEARVSTDGTGNYYAGFVNGKAAETAANYNYQLWKFVSVGDDNSKVAIVNKGLNKYYPWADAEKYLQFTTNPEATFLLKNISGNEIGIMPSEAERNNNGTVGITFQSTAFQLPGIIALSTANADQAFTRRYASTFKFTAAGNTAALPNITKDSFDVVIENGSIRVLGTEAPFTVYNISGQIVNAKNQLSKGIYIVRVGSNSKKIMVH